MLKACSTAATASSLSAARRQERAFSLLLFQRWSSDLWLFRELGKKRSVAAGFRGIPCIPALSKSSRNKQRVPLPHTGTHLPSHSPRAPAASVHTPPPSVALLKHAAKTKQSLLPLPPPSLSLQGDDCRGTVVGGPLLRKPRAKGKRKHESHRHFLASLLEPGCMWL